MPKSRLFSISATLAAILLMTGTAAAHSTQSGDISVGHIWAYPAVANAAHANGNMKGPAMTGGNAIDVFGPLLNGGGTAEAVTGVTSDDARSADIVMWVRGHQMTRDFPLALPSGKPIALGPQTQFIRLYGVDKLYRPGDSFPVTFHFQHTPDATIEVVVQAK